MEYHVTKATDVASRIFEKGLDTFGDEVDYVLRYLGFLISVNDNNSQPCFRLDIDVINVLFGFLQMLERSLSG
jgi:hypothetical protein